MSKSRNSVFTVLDTVNSAILKVEEFLLGIITIALVAAIFVEVSCRYIFMVSTAWSEELARYLFVMLTFVGSSYAYYKHDHIEIDILNQVIRSSKKIKNKDRVIKAVNMIGNISTMIFLVIFNHIFWTYLMQIKNMGLLSPTMHLPMVWVYSFVWIGGALTVVHGVYMLLCDVFKHEEA